jgi:hypothetical protein
MQILSKSLILFFYLAFNISVIYSAQILLHGKIIDETTGEPIGTSFEFRSPTGEKITVLSNALDGSYQQILNSETSYEVVFYNDTILRQIEKITTMESEKYTEEYKDFRVKKLVKGRIIFRIAGYSRSSQSLNNSLMTFFADFEEKLRFNRFLKVEFIVNAHDTYFKPAPPPSPPPEEPQKGKKQKRKEIPKQEVYQQIPEPSPQEIKALVDARIASLNQYIQGKPKLKNRFTVSGDYSLAPSENPTAPTVFIKVTEATNPLKETK